MAKHFLADYVEGEPEFKAEPWYNECGDCLEYLCANEAVVADRVDGILTLYRSAEDNRVIGFQLKGVAALMRKYGSGQAAVAAKTNQGQVVSIMFLLLAAVKESRATGTGNGLETYRAALRELGRVMDVDRKVEVLEPAGC
ncbi:MAG: hypothetical protein ACLF0G_09000 [Candidatus Brocadiia bacterium]